MRDYRTNQIQGGVFMSFPKRGRSKNDPIIIRRSNPKEMQQAVSDLTILFEGRQYKFKRMIRLNNVSKHVYRNEDERHTLYIHTRNSKPFYVEGIYSLKELAND